MSITEQEPDKFTEADQASLQLSVQVGKPPASLDGYISGLAAFVTDQFSHLLGPRISDEVSEPDVAAARLLAELEQIRVARHEDKTSMEMAITRTRRHQSVAERDRQMQEKKLKEQLRVINEQQAASTRGVIRSPDQSQRILKNRLVVGVMISCLVLAFVAFGVLEKSNPASGQPALTVEPKVPIAPQANPLAPVKSPLSVTTVIPPGFVAVTKTGVIEAIKRDSTVPLKAPATLIVWKNLMVQATSSKLIVGAGNYNVFASSYVAGNAKYGSQAYLYQAILTGSGGNPHYYYKGANSVVLEGLIPMTPKRGQQIASEMGIKYAPYGVCQPTAAIQPVTCGPLNSLLVAARYVNDIGAALSTDPVRFAAYKSQLSKGLFGAGAFLPITKLADITCVWHPELAKVKAGDMQCKMAATMAYAWRNNTLIGSLVYRGMLKSRGFAQLLAQAKAELVREHWLK